MRVALPIVLSEEVRRKLKQQSRGRSAQARVVLRSRIVLLAGEGFKNKQIAAALKVAPRMAALWRGRFLERGIEGLLQDAPRPGRTPTISRASLIEKTTQSVPANATQWSTRTMAREMGISKASVSRIWRASGLEAASRGGLQGQQRSAVRRETGGHRRTVFEPARARAGVKRG
jgi:transposase